MTEEQKKQNQQPEQQEQVSDEQLENVSGGVDFDELRRENRDKSAVDFDELRRENRDKS